MQILLRVNCITVVIIIIIIVFLAYPSSLFWCPYFVTASQQLQAVALDLVKESFGNTLFGKAMDCVMALREQTIKVWALVTLGGCHRIRLILSGPFLLVLYIEVPFLWIAVVIGNLFCLPLQGSNPQLFNDFLLRVKGDLKGTRYYPFWEKVVGEGVTLISSTECEASPISQEEAIKVGFTYIWPCIGLGLCTGLL